MHDNESSHDETMNEKYTNMVGIKGKSGVGSGGKREGAGRHPKEHTKWHLNITIDYDLGEYVKSKDNRSGFINQCIREKKEREQ